MKDIIIHPLTKILSLIKRNTFVLLWDFFSVTIKTAWVSNTENLCCQAAFYSQTPVSFEFSGLSSFMNHLPKALHICKLKCYRCFCQPFYEYNFPHTVLIVINSKNGILIFYWRKENQLNSMWTAVFLSTTLTLTLNIGSILLN